jgi:hypothetical protein
MRCRTLRSPVLVERYPDGLRITFDCGHALYTRSTVERERYRCPLCFPRPNRRRRAR